MSEEELADVALRIQDACNLAPVVGSFFTAISALWAIAHERKLGTDWVNQHPVSKAFASKISSLAGEPNAEEWRCLSELAEKNLSRPAKAPVSPSPTT